MSDGIDKFHIKEFGENVFFFSPEDEADEVQEILSRIYKKQEANHFGEERFAIYFMPGEYDEKIKPMVGFATQVSGLGILPEDTVLGSLNCEAKWQQRPGNNVALSNFWRGIENLKVTDTVMWAVSQATFMRKMDIEGDLYLHDDEGWASGGFMADCRIKGCVDTGPQQQWFSRNSDWNGWRGYGWNMVYAGIEEGKVPKGEWPEKPYTSLETIDEISEKPYLVYDKEMGLCVNAGSIKKNSRGIDWNEKNLISLDEFYIAREGMDDSASLNKALKEGKHLLITPGIYPITDTLMIEKDNTIVLGMGLATLRSEKECNCICKIKGEGIRVAGILLDAGEGMTEKMLQVGDVTDESYIPEVPTVLSDIFFRIGGAFDYSAVVEVALEINSNHVIGDNFWIWRADHGKGVGWEKNRANHGMIVNGRKVTTYALMVEHFNKHQVIWKGEEGKTVMYQCETPYDPPSQELWMSHEGTVKGYASYVVDEKVKNHTAYGLGIYSFHRDAVLDLENAVETPMTNGVKFTNICTVMLNGANGINHIINGKGEAVLHRGQRAVFMNYPE